MLMCLKLLQICNSLRQGFTIGTWFVSFLKRDTFAFSKAQTLLFIYLFSPYLTILRHNVVRLMPRIVAARAILPWLLCHACIIASTSAFILWSFRALPLSELVKSCALSSAGDRARSSS